MSERRKESAEREERARKEKQEAIEKKAQRVRVNILNQFIDMLSQYCNV